MNALALVEEFHRVMKHRYPVPVVPDVSNSAINELRVKLLREELTELRDALESGNRIDQLDALCDIQYVLSGAVLDWGLKSLWPESFGMRSDIRNTVSHLTAMSGLLTQAEDHAQRGFPAHLLESLCRFQNRLDTLVLHLGFGDVFADAFAEVHRSNMSKLWSDGDKEGLVGLRTNVGESVMFSETEGGWIARRADGKIIKSPSYSPADLRGFVK